MNFRDLHVGDEIFLAHPHGVTLVKVKIKSIESIDGYKIAKSEDGAVIEERNLENVFFNFKAAKKKCLKNLEENYKNYREFINNLVIEETT